MRLFYAMNLLLLHWQRFISKETTKQANKRKKECKQSQTDFMILFKLRPNLIVFRCLCNELTFIVKMWNQLDHIYIRSVPFRLVRDVVNFGA